MQVLRMGLQAAPRCFWGWSRTARMGARSVRRGRSDPLIARQTTYTEGSWSSVHLESKRSFDNMLVCLTFGVALSWSQAGRELDPADCWNSQLRAFSLCIEGEKRTRSEQPSEVRHLHSERKRIRPSAHCLIVCPWLIALCVVPSCSAASSRVIDIPCGTSTTRSARTPSRRPDRRRLPARPKNCGAPQASSSPRYQSLLAVAAPHCVGAKAKKA